MKQLRKLVVLGILACSLPSLATTITTLDDPSLFDNVAAQPGGSIGDSSWQATSFGTPDAKSFGWLNFDPASSIMLGDISAVRFDTNKPISHNSSENDFYLSLYTQADGSNDGAGWYGNRLNLDPFYAINIDSTADSWTTWSTDGGINQLRVYDYPAAGSYTAPTWDELLDPSYSDDGVNSLAEVDYASEKLLGIAFSTGSAWGDSFMGALDNIVIEFSNGDSWVFDLEASSVPEPASVLLLGAGMLLLRLGRRS